MGRDEADVERIVRVTAGLDAVAQADRRGNHAAACDGEAVVVVVDVIVRVRGAGKRRETREGAALVEVGLVGLDDVVARREGWEVVYPPAAGHSGVDRRLITVEAGARAVVVE